jgi:hypothetical protein
MEAALERFPFGRILLPQFLTSFRVGLYSCKAEAAFLNLLGMSCDDKGSTLSGLFPRFLPIADGACRVGAIENYLSGGSLASASITGILRLSRCSD